MNTIKKTLNLRTITLLCASILITTGCQASGDGHENSHGAHDHAESASMMQAAQDMHGDHQHAEETNFGKPGVLSEVTRTIEVSMGDNMRFTPDNISVKKGETIRFVITNTGAIEHEMVLGTADELREHAEMMRKMPGMQHSDPSTVRVAAGKTGEMIWNFDLTGDFDFACLVPGHSEAGMVGKVVVE